MRIIITTLIFIGFYTTTFSQEKRLVTTKLLNVRSGAGVNYEVINQVNEGDTIISLEAVNTWTKIELASGEIGYVSTEFLSEPLTVENSSSKDKKGSSWFGTIFAIVVGLVIINAARKTLFSKTFSRESSSKNSNQNSKTVVPKKNENYICKHCGAENKSLSSLTFHSCHRSPTGKHQPLEGGIQEIYSCKHCGTKNKSLSSLTFHSCHRSPTGKHQPLF